VGPMRRSVLLLATACMVALGLSLSQVCLSLTLSPTPSRPGGLASLSRHASPHRHTNPLEGVRADGLAEGALSVGYSGRWHKRVRHLNFETHPPGTHVQPTSQAHLAPSFGSGVQTLSRSGPEAAQPTSILGVHTKRA